MRVLYHSAAPWRATGYGRVTREVVPRLVERGHDIAVQCLNSVEGDSIMWHGENIDYELEEPVKVYPSESTFGLEDYQRHFLDYDADIHYTHFDTWMEQARETIPKTGIPYVSYVIVDHQPAPNVVVEQVKRAEEVVSMSKWAKKELEKKGVENTYIPHGVNTEEFKPIETDEDIRVEVEGEMGSTRTVNVSKNTFFGMVAANHGDRKHIPAHMEAFKIFLEKWDSDALMYIHTNPKQDTGFNLSEIRNEIGIPKENIMFAAPDKYSDIGDDELNQWYNAFDVLINCSIGESWGLTLTEAMSAGTPVIGNYFSSIPEQLGVDPEDEPRTIHKNMGSIADRGGVHMGGHGLLVDPCVDIFREKVSAKQKLCHPADIYKAMKHYDTRDELVEEHGEKAREHVKENYDWDDNIVPELEKTLQRAVNNL